MKFFKKHQITYRGKKYCILGVMVEPSDYCTELEGGDIVNVADLGLWWAVSSNNDEKGKWLNGKVYTYAKDGLIDAYYNGKVSDKELKSYLETIL